MYIENIPKFIRKDDDTYYINIDRINNKYIKVSSLEF